MIKISDEIAIPRMSDPQWPTHNQCFNEDFRVATIRLRRIAQEIFDCMHPVLSAGLRPAYIVMGLDFYRKSLTMPAKIAAKERLIEPVFLPPLEVTGTPQVAIIPWVMGIFCLPGKPILDGERDRVVEDACSAICSSCGNKPVIRSDGRWVHPPPFGHICRAEKIRDRFYG